MRCYSRLHSLKRQTRPKFLSNSVQPDPHIARTDGENLSQLVVLMAIGFGHQKESAFRLPKSGQADFHGLEHKDSRAGPRVTELDPDPVPFAQVREIGLAGSLPVVVDDSVSQNGAQPGPNVASAQEGFPLANRLKQRILKKVFGVRAATHGSASLGVQVVTVVIQPPGRVVEARGLNDTLWVDTHPEDIKPASPRPDCKISPFVTAKASASSGWG